MRLARIVPPMFLEAIRLLKPLNLEELLFLPPVR